MIAQIRAADIVNMVDVRAVVAFEKIASYGRKLFLSAGGETAN